MCIPTWLGSFNLWKRLFLGHNRFTGTIPSFLCTLSRLCLLGLTGNSMTDSILTWFESLKFIQVLTLGVNLFTGTLSNTLSKIRQMSYFTSDKNWIYGTIPTWLNNIYSLQTLKINLNSYFGTIFIFSSNLSQLIWLSIAKNFFSGTLPSSTVSLPTSAHLAVEQSNLIGQIGASNPTNFLSSMLVAIGSLVNWLFSSHLIIVLKPSFHLKYAKIVNWRPLLWMDKAQTLGMRDIWCWTH